MTKKNLILLIGLLCLNTIFANILIKGKLVDSSTNQPIPFADIYIKNTTIGVISNKDGFFEINIPQKQAHVILVFSFMGFDTYEVNLSKLDPKVFQIIKLRPSITSLDQVSFSVKALSVNKIVKQAFANYYKNFPDNPFIAKGFLRHTEKTKTEYKWLVEAAIEVYDPGFNKSSKNIKTNVLEVRKSLDNRYVDTLTAYKWYAEQVLKQSKRKTWSLRNTDNIHPNVIAKAIQHQDNYFTLRGGWGKSFLYTLFSTDHNKIRYYKQNNAILDGGLLNKHRFKLDTILVYNSKDIYKIKILPSLPPSNLNRFNKNYVLPFGWIYIRKDDYAIMEFKYLLVENENRDGILSKTTGSKVASVYDIKFTDYKGKMYPKYMSLATPKGNRFMEAANAVLGGKKIDPEIYYYTKEEIVFNKIITDKEAIKLRLQKPWDDDLFTPHPYHAKFWKNYNVLLESTEQQKLIQDLEKKVKLKEQFEHNK